MKVDIQKFNNLIRREESQRDQLLEHTLDWYTYTNRVTLLKEVVELFYPDPVVETPEPEAQPSKAPRKQKLSDSKEA